MNEMVQESRRGPTGPTAPGSGGQGVAAVAGKFLTFFLDEEEYGLEILKVHEIIGMMDVTPVPRTPKFILGVINLRGKVIPILDLRSKFGMARIEQTEETCIIVVQTQGTQIGIVVDRVSEVQSISAEDIEPTPNFGGDFNAEYILGIGTPGGQVKLLVDIDCVIATQDVVRMLDTGTLEPEHSTVSRDHEGVES